MTTLQLLADIYVHDSDTGFNVGGLLGLLVWVIIIGLVFWLLFWLISYVAPPEPFAKVLKVILAVIAVLFLIGVLLSVAGHPIIHW